VTESQQPPKSNALRPVKFIGLIFGGVLAVVAVSKWWVPAEVVPWRDNFAAAQTEARAANKPMLVYFTASWCEPCQWMRRYVWTDRRVADALKNYVPVRIDVDKDPTTAIRFHVEPIPAFFIITPDGQIARTYEGAMEAQEFINWVGRGS
jgi:thiol:disulfide interchange protein